MMKRWIIRSLSLLPLVCVVAVWVASYWLILGVEDIKFNLGVAGGRLSVYHDALSGTAPTWRVYAKRATSDWAGWDSVAKPDVVGFTLRSDPNYGGGTMPLWFPTLLSAVLFWLVWRRTQPKPIGRAFPIEPTAKPGEPKP